MNVSRTRSSITRRHALAPFPIGEGLVTLGSTVTVKLPEDNAELTFTIVDGPGDVRSGRVSAAAPMAQALLGAACGAQRAFRVDGQEISALVVAVTTPWSPGLAEVEDVR